MAFTYPRIWLNGVACEHPSSDRWTLHPDHPPRSVALPNLVSHSAPNIDGALWTPQGVHGAPLFTTTLRIIGQGSGADAQNLDAEQAVDQWAAIVSQPRVTIRHQMYASGAGANRYTTGRLEEFEDEYEIASDRSVIKLNMIFELPDVFWSDANFGVQNILFSQPAVTTNTTYVLDSEGNAPLQEGQIRIVGPISNPMVTDLGSGDWISFSGSVAAGSAIRMDLSTLRCYSGTSAAVNWTSTALTNSSASMNLGGSGLLVPTTFRMIPRWIASGDIPANTGIAVRLTGSGTTSATTLEIRGRRGYR